MSIRVMTLVWDNFHRSGSELVVMLALADWCNDEGGSLHPSISSIAAKARISESQARRIVHSFIDDGYLSVIANHNGGDKGQTRHYKMNIKRLSTPCMDDTPKENIPRKTTSVSDTPCIYATPSTDAHEPLAPMRVTPSTHDTQTTINHHKNHQGGAHENSMQDFSEKTDDRKKTFAELDLKTIPADWVESLKRKHPAIPDDRIKLEFDDFESFWGGDSVKNRSHTPNDWMRKFLGSVAKNLMTRPIRVVSAGQAQQDQESRQTETPAPRPNAAFAGLDLYAFNALKKRNPELTQAHVRELAQMREQDVSVVMAQMKKEQETAA